MAVQSEHKDVYWFGHEWPYVKWVSLRFMLPCTGVLVVGVISFREREQVPSLLSCGGGFECGFPFHLRVPRAPRARQKTHYGGQAPLITPQGLRRGGEFSLETPIVPKASPQGSSEIEFAVCVLFGPLMVGVQMCRVPYFTPC
jgi:hypothetical protein